jgi:uncharacterized protein (TIGR00255 family)
MTGYGRAAAIAKGQSVVVELRSVNHRFLEIKLRGAGAGGALEDQIGARVRQCFERGSVVVSVMVRADEATAFGPSGIDRARATQVFRDLSELATALGLPPPTLADVLASPALQSPGPSFEAVDEAAVLALVEQAVAEAVAMRRTEGEALGRDLAARVEKLAALTAELRGLAEQSAPVLAERLHDRVRKLLAQLAPAAEGAQQSGGVLTGGIEPGRLAQEVALLVDRADITEELVRLASHLEQARSLLVAPGSLGRRLEFLLQEIGRELNTIGAKSWSSAISTRIVEAKSELEKLREQAQNVE